MTGSGSTRRIITMWLHVPVLLGLAFTVAVSVGSDIPIGQFTRDPAAIMGGHPLSGVISSVGVLFWGASVAVCGFTALVLRRRRHDRDLMLFIVIGGFVSAMLLADDLLMVHEYWVPITLGLPEALAYITYGLVTVGYLWWFRSLVAQSAVGLLAAAGMFFAFSLGVDLLPEATLPFHLLFEDGAKLLGIVNWLGYLVTVCVAALDHPTA